MSTAVKAVPSMGETQVPPAPVTVKDTGLTPETISDLVLKTLYVQGSRTGQQLTDTLCLPFDIVDESLVRLQERRFIEVLRTMGPSRGGYVFELAGMGRERAAAALEASQYVGPAPVTLADYRNWIEAQSVRNLHIGRMRIREGFKHLVISEHMLESLGPAVNSASSLFLHGDPGNGKTVIAEAIAAMLGGDIHIPYSVDVEGQVMSLFDPVHHEVVTEPLQLAGGEGGPQWLRQAKNYDQRFVRVKRPVVFVGGELSLEQLDLQYDAYTKMYQAPFQLKAAGGVLIIDDFGRQLVAPRDLLNRWIVPLEKRVDYLTLHTGIKFPVPFDCLLIFATNLNPEQLVDEAFLRRIQYKINVADPDRVQYEEIFRRECSRRGVEYDTRAIEHIYTRYYRGRGILARCCHPRDILDHLVHAARYEEREVILTPALLDQACESYFLVMAHQDKPASAVEA
jgi:predicted ATPase with chaperone activity